MRQVQTNLICELNEFNFKLNTKWRNGTVSDCKRDGRRLDFQLGNE